MKLLNVLCENEGANKKRMRVGRGIGCTKGKTCGKGVKGQKARCGVAINGFEGGQMSLIWRLPKRGFRSVNKQKYHVLNLESIEYFISVGKLDANEINHNSLVDAGLIKKLKYPVKILSKRVFTGKVNITANSFSEQAKALIEKNGGKVEIV
jgi:large subunit ribosomal protein L15